MGWCGSRSVSLVGGVPAGVSVVRGSMVAAREEVHGGPEVCAFVGEQ